ncbi:MAG: outer membrane lipoprotein chaperone LolA [Deltaproteobacteria bacterium]|nr:outer membrane lipoprotein chaperone LolA [Deltaproteobacteria bacterium]
MKTFLVRLFLCVAVLFSTGYSVYAAPPASVQTIVKKLQARYDSTKGFRADFTQEVESATLGQKVTANGKVFFKKPGRMRWEFVDPEQLLVSDGKFFWLHQPKEKQVLKTPFAQAFRSSSPASFLLGVGQITKDFTPTLHAQEAKTYTLRLTPKKDPEAIGLLDLEVDMKTFDIVQATIIDPVGNTTRVRFTNINRKSPADESLFRFTVPDGVDVVEPPSNQ